MNKTGSVPRAVVDEPWHRLGRAVAGVKLRTARNRLAVTRRKSPVLTGIHFAVILPTILGATSLLAVGFGAIQSDIVDEGLARTFLASVMAIFVLGAFIGSSTTALQALYLADDIPFLLTLPIPLRALFGGKFVEAGIGTWPSAILFIAGTCGYGFARAQNPTYWLISPIVGLAIAMLATSASVVVVSVVTRFIPPRRARLFLLAISVGLVGSTTAAWRFLSPRPQALGDVVNGSDYAPLWNTLAWTPVGWGAKAMTAAAKGDFAGSIIPALLLAGASTFAVATSFNIFRRTFIRGLAQTRAVQTNAPNESFTRWLGYSARLFPTRLGATVLKEWLVLFRDLRRLSGAVWPVGIVLIYTVILGRGSESDFGSRDLAFWSRNGSLALLPWGLSLGISVYTYGSEGRNIHLLRALPLSAARIYLAKALASILPVAVVSLGSAAISLFLRQSPIRPSLELLSLIIWMVAGFVVIDTAAAALAPNFETDQVQRTIGLTGRIYSFAAGGLFASSTLVAAARLILMSAEPPASIADLLANQSGGLDLFGWPLVVFSGVTAMAVVGFSASLAIRQTERLIRSGF